MTEESLTRLLQRLPQATVDEPRADRTRMRCHAALARRRRAAIARERDRPNLHRWEVPTVAAFCVAYLLTVLRDAIR